jgi:hypothetical protein
MKKFGVLDRHVVVEHGIHLGCQQIHFLFRPRPFVVFLRQSVVLILAEKDVGYPGCRVNQGWRLPSGLSKGPHLLLG